MHNTFVLWVDSTLVHVDLSSKIWELIETKKVTIESPFGFYCNLRNAQIISLASVHRLQHHSYPFDQLPIHASHFGYHHRHL